jgi:hypothetical protein
MRASVCRASLGVLASWREIHILLNGEVMNHRGTETPRKGVKRVVCGDPFKSEGVGRGFAFRLFCPLCASVSLCVSVVHLQKAILCFGCDYVTGAPPQKDGPTSPWPSSPRSALTPFR